MKLLFSLFLLTFTASLFADIQDPPMNEQGPTRKLGRGISNIVFCLNELPHTVGMINEREGNEAALSYGIVKGAGRVFYRFGKGVYEFVTFPFPRYKGSYRPAYDSNIPWIHGGYSEFPPELGFETRYRYSRNYNVY